VAWSSLFDVTIPSLFFLSEPEGPLSGRPCFLPELLFSRFPEMSSRRWPRRPARLHPSRWRARLMRPPLDFFQKSRPSLFSSPPPFPFSSDGLLPFVCLQLATQLLRFFPPLSSARCSPCYPCVLVYLSQVSGQPSRAAGRRLDLGGEGRPQNRLFFL